MASFLVQGRIVWATIPDSQGGNAKRRPFFIVTATTEIDPNGSVLFRVKVADSVGERGRLLGSAERIQPLSDDENKDRRSLFPVQPWKLGEQLWKVDIESGSRPVLLVNRDIPEIKQWFRDKLLIRASVFPAAFRIVMEAIALGDAEDDSDDEDETAGWHEDWLKFCRDRLGVIDAIPAERPDREKWIDSAVERFCNQFNFVTTLKNAEAEEPR